MELNKPVQEPLSEQPPLTRPCSKCGSQRVEVVGRSVNPSMVYFGCRGCGYLAGERDDDELGRP